MANALKARFISDENRKWWTLGAVSFGLFMIMLDNTVVNVALPSIERSLHLGVAELEWVVAGYALTFGAFMLTGGKLSDMFGRRAMFVVGLVIFTGASLGCGLSGNASILIAARIVQGLGAALMNPSTLSIITVTFPPRQRGTAIGIWAGVSALALAIGPLVGGLITERVNWNWIFFINVPIGLLAIAAAFAFIEESRDSSAEQRLDFAGLATSALALFALSFGLIEANTDGWGSAKILAAFAIAVVALAAFIALEARQRLPMLDLSLFRNRSFSGANTVMLLVALAMFGVFFYVSLYMQQVLGFSPIEAGASFLPLTVLIILIAPLAGRFSDRFGSRTFAGSGMFLLAVSLFLFSRLGVHADFFGLLPGLLTGGAGMALTMTPTTAAAMASVRRDKAGVGSAVLNSMRQVGGSLGIAIMGAIVASGLSNGLRLGETRPVAFTNGLHGGLEVASLIALAGSAVAFATVRKPAQVDPSSAPVLVEA
jgi:EmrB/QacA subfamily drug resistance transporter